MNWETCFWEQGDGDNDWNKLIEGVRNIVNQSFKIRGRDLRIGQKIMLGLNERRQDLFNALTNTEFDIWEVTDPFDPKIEKFAEELFRKFVETL